MTPSETESTRRRWLQRAGLAIVAAPALAAFATSSARAAGKTPKADVGYQFTPHGDQHCGACTSFIPGDSRQGAGTCKIVDGVIPQSGWCSLFSKR
jgi:hypothetical protein